MKCNNCNKKAEYIYLGNSFCKKCRKVKVDIDNLIYLTRLDIASRNLTK